MSRTVFSSVTSLLLVVGWQAIVAAQFAPPTYSEPVDDYYRDYQEPLAANLLSDYGSTFEYQDDLPSVVDPMFVPVEPMQPEVAFESSGSESRRTSRRISLFDNRELSSRVEVNRSERQTIRDMDILERPSRPFHIYGNTLRRRSNGGTPLLGRGR